MNLLLDICEYTMHQYGVRLILDIHLKFTIYSRTGLVFKSLAFAIAFSFAASLEFDFSEEISCFPENL